MRNRLYNSYIDHTDSVTIFCTKEFFNFLENFNYFSPYIDKLASLLAYIKETDNILRKRWNMYTTVQL